MQRNNAFAWCRCLVGLLSLHLWLEGTTSIDKIEKILNDSKIPIFFLLNVFFSVSHKEAGNENKHLARKDKTAVTQSKRSFAIEEP